ncbi:death ligand signal enhancer isoform X1 [Phyllopteryx taeniolatus]|uniref:death ligand signal enhancer isoform X1 n=2 Tax=Phyllopteryx taeniolatus TaxID=161469 RepID=UPI002AD3D3BA|nr:death ligand signal enhancer isoform X1 [Phyllopteryx taeniolatus]
MWRVKGLAWRVLHRYHTSTSLRLPQNHHVEDEVLNTSTVLSTSRNSSDSSSHKEEDGERRKKQRAFKFSSASLPRYTALDAVGWGATAVLFMQICRRIHATFSSCTESGPTSGVQTPPPALHECGYRLLLDILSSNDMVLRGKSVLCLHNQSLSSSSSSSSSGGSEAASSRSERNPLTPNTSVSDYQAALGQDSSLQGDASISACGPQEYVFEKEGAETDHAGDKCMLAGKARLAEAAQNLEEVSDSSVPVILNIIGLQRAESGNDEEAFSCFLAAAQRGYGKALFNVGVCYEKGRGVGKDREKVVPFSSFSFYSIKASHYYWRAAVAGHQQSQYRWAKLLLTSRGHQSEEKLKTAIGLLEKAAAAGLTKAQVCLASVYSREPVRDGSKSVHYLQVAAESSDATALLLLGQCYESGFGVRQNPSAALGLYKRAARAGNEQARLLLTPPGETDVLRSIRSSPCFSVSDRDLRRPLSSLADRVRADVALPFLPHSWSTGSMDTAPGITSTPRYLHPQSLEGKSCQWMVGVG